MRLHSACLASASVLLSLAMLPAAQAQSVTTFTSIESYLDHYRSLAAFDGVVLVRDHGVTVASYAVGEADYRFHVPMAPGYRFRIASLSKQFTVGLFGRLSDRGALSLDQVLSDFLPDYPRADAISLIQLLDGSSGIPHTNEQAWLDMTRAMSLTDIIANLAAMEPDFEPGTDSAYSNGAYAVAAAVIERVTGLTFEQALLAEFGTDYPSLGHEDAYEIVANEASRYAPGPVYGERREAETYLVANRIGGGSLYASALDVARFFEDSHGGRLVSAEMTAELFPMPQDGDFLITGRSPGTLAQIYHDQPDALTVVSLSSNSSWPGSFNADITALQRGETVTLLAADPAEPFDPAAHAALVGQYRPTVFNWQWDVRIEAGASNMVFIQDGNAYALMPTRAGGYHLPVYDWLCDFDAPPGELSCRQRAVDADFRFTFQQVGGRDLP